VSGVAAFGDFEEGLSVKMQTDELTGLSNYEVLDPKDRPPSGKDMRPVVRLLDDAGTAILTVGDAPVQYFLQPGAIVSLERGARIGIGDVIARIPQESLKTRDITGGLPRVADLFEARKPKESAILAEVSQ